MAVAAIQLYTPEEYLELERKAETRSEFLHGRIYAMAGASEEHNLITVNLVSTLHLQFKGKPCKVYSQDMRMKVSETGLYTYPDVVALCEKARFEDERVDILLNPSLIIEALSPATEGYDRGDKFAHYRRLESLKEYVLVSQDKMRVERFVRQPDNRWLLSEASQPEEIVPLESVGAELRVADIYDKVEFEMEEA